MNDLPETQAAEMTAITDREPGPGPPSRESLDESTAPSIRTDEPSAMQVFLVWEKLRLLCNGVLVAALLFSISGLKGEFDGRFLAQLLIVLFLVNAVCSMGTVIEGYLCWFGIRRSAARGIAFVLVSTFGAAIPTIWLWR
jgi:hypothetical protein